MWFKQSFYSLKTHLLGCKSILSPIKNIGFARQKLCFCNSKLILLENQRLFFAFSTLFVEILNVKMG
jgi:hypothetical protein